MSARASVFRRSFTGDFPTERPPHLTEREWAMLAAHVRDARTLDDISRQHGIARERVRQICAAAMRKLGYEFTIDPPTAPTDPVVRMRDGSRRYARRQALEAWWYGRAPYPR